MALPYFLLSLRRTFSPRKSISRTRAITFGFGDIRKLPSVSQPWRNIPKDEALPDQGEIFVLAVTKVTSCSPARNGQHDVVEKRRVTDPAAVRSITQDGLGHFPNAKPRFVGRSYDTLVGHKCRNSISFEPFQ